MNITQNIVTSANWMAGREGNAITGIVLHTMVGTSAGAYSRFNNPASQVSVHYGVELDGTIYRWVDEKDTAYQAGNWGVNLRTIGVEHSDANNPNDSVRTPAEYNASSDLVADICKRHNIPCDTNHIFLHKNVIDTSVYPGGTACPDGLDTGKIIAMAAAKIGANDVTLPTKQQVADAYNKHNLNPDGTATPATQQDLDYYSTQDVSVLYAVLLDHETNLAHELVTQAAAQATILKPGRYQVD